MYSHAQLWSGVLSSSRAADWTNAGVAGGIPTNRTQCGSTITAYTGTAATINNALANCGVNQYVQLGVGTFNLSDGVTFGNLNNVTLRGMGAGHTILHFTGTTGCGLITVICLSSDNTDQDHITNTATWTGTAEGGAGIYPKGATHVTLNNVSNLAVGGQIYLDQLDDTSDGFPTAGYIYVCQTVNVCTGQGGGKGRPNRHQIHVGQVMAINGNTVTISPPLTMPNWRSSQSPGAWWPTSSNVMHDNGIEDLTVNGVNSGGQCGTCANIVIFNARNIWVKGVRSIEPNTTGGNPLSAHVWIYYGAFDTIRDSYFYGGDNWSQSYGIEEDMFNNVLIENNIFQHVTAPIVPQGGGTGGVSAYNFSIDDNYTGGGSAPGWMDPTITWHEVGEAMNLDEGNSGLGLDADNIHGTHHFGTFFRNHYYGDIWNNPAKNGNTQIMQLQAYSRFFNFVGNVLGRSGGYYNTYDAHSANAIFDTTGSTYPGVSYPADSQTGNTLMRWGNYDTVTGTSRFVSSEVPSGLSHYANPVPNTQNLPASFYLSGKPSWWVFPNGTTAPFPAIGPDVTGGNGPGGHSYAIPAENCWYNVMGGVVGTSGLLTFNASGCYGSSGGSVNPPSGLTARVQ